MKSILKIRDFESLNSIQEKLSKNEPLSKNQSNLLLELLEQLPEPDFQLSSKIPQNYPIEITVWDLGEIQESLEKWRRLFENIPGFDYCPFSYFVDNDNITLLKENVLIAAVFAPSMAYNLQNIAFEVHLVSNGTAKFLLPSIAEPDKFPELYNFKGSWHQAYMLMIETLKKGWPRTEFPIELQKFLSKTS